MKIKLWAFGVFIFLLGCSREEVNVPKMDIQVSSEIPKEKKIACEIKYIENGDSLLINAGIKRRGGGSIKYKKHSYRIELDSKIPLAGLPRDDDWILNANYIDKTFMRHKISYDLFRKMHPENIAPRCNYIEVFINGNYNGLYVLMEKIDASTTFLKKKDSGAILYKEPPVFFKEKLEFVQDSNNYFQQKFPKKRKADKTKFIKDFQTFLFESDDAVFFEEIQKRVNLRNTIDWHLLLLFSNNSDGILKNFYLLKRDSESLLEFIPWDYDHSFGRDGDNELNMMRHELNVNRSVLLKRLNESKIYRKKLRDRYLYLRRKGLFSLEYFDALIRENDRMINPLLDLNFEKWPVKSYWYFDDSTYEAELELMRNYVKIRLKDLDTFFAAAQE